MSEGNPARHSKQAYCENYVINMETTDRASQLPQFVFRKLLCWNSKSEWNFVKECIH